jgi:hypothetical protein
LQARDPEFKLQYWQKRKKEKGKFFTAAKDNIGLREEWFSMRSTRKNFVEPGSPMASSLIY